MARIFRTCHCHCTVFKIILFLLVSSVGLYHLIVYILTYEADIPFSTVVNYFLESGNSAQHGYIIDTPTCNILNLSAWDEAILPFVTAKSRHVDCGAELRQWTYTTGTNLVINTTSLEHSGYSFNSVTCCYMTITRVNQSPSQFDFDADRRVVFSKDCTPLTKIINPINAEFVRVICTGKYWPFMQDVLYRQFHCLAQPSKDASFESKMSFWAGKSISEIPPSVIIIGVDSMSRLSFHRNMNRTKEVLQGMGAVEILGYTKVGENTFPNAVPLLSGYFESEIKKICFYNKFTPHDACPYIYKRFSAANYLTALIEDVPGLGGFQYQKVGFVQQPSDFYNRPFMLAVHQHTPNPWWTLDCIGYRTVDQILLEYIADLLTLSKVNQIPLFVYSWMTNLAHEDINSAQHGDSFYADFLEKADLQNAILFFMSDHGYRYGSIRSTFPGWYEEKLPTLWIRLPIALKQRFPDWQKHLELNSRRLTSTFDLYQTMTHVLDLFTTTEELPNGQDQSGIPIERKFGQSLFTEVPLERQCKDAGIGENFCACAIPNKLSPNDTIVIGAAAAAVEKINSFIPAQCAQLGLVKIAAAAVMKGSENSSTYIVAFVTTPGDFVFEANVNHEIVPGTDVGHFSITTAFLRMSKMTTDVSCIHDAILEKFCFCRNI